ncbi:hypothetical protein F8271_15160 [Micromonospora sp. ALFpr18c]|uniref:DUF6297 family protein n=1 Tax=unclassified Micromonospora TaxID=2617518 RepID=UPI00124B244A|nr:MULTISPECIES: DUF6297 family protein [unclassified Micromonospora]KAB1940923.1 hypothetical protein F8271_15160 [Micromonospora sp. ALFpr18c]MDG4758322.1 DUF6297 family protein [Micromonospora sp. WMMD710]
MTAPPATIAATPAGLPTARQVRTHLRQARRRHHEHSLGDVLGDAYVMVLFVGMYGWFAISASRDMLDSPTVGQAEPGVRWWLAVATLLAGAGLAWRGLRALGPLLVTPATQSWVTSAPVDRRAWLAPRLAVLLAGAAAGTAALGVAVAALGGVNDPAALGWAAAAGAGWGAAALALSVVAQGSRTGRRWPTLAGAAPMVAAAVITGLVVLTGRLGDGLPRPASTPTVALAAVGVPLAVAGTILAVRALPRVDRATLTTGAQFANAAATATILLDPSLLTGLVESRRWRRIGRVRSSRFLPGPGWWALLQADVRRLRRHPSALLIWAALIGVQYAAALALPGLAGAAQVVLAYVAADRLTGGLRSISRSPGLRRALGGSDALLRGIHVVVPALGAGLWWLLTLPTVDPGPQWLAPTLALGVVAAAFRAGTRPPIDYGGATVNTPFGMIPVDLLRQGSRGPALLAVLVLVQLFLG